MQCSLSLTIFTEKKFHYLLILLITLFVQDAAAQWSNDAAVNTPVTVASGTQEQFKSVSDGNGGVIITWVDTRNGNQDIYAQRISSTGTAMWTANGVVICNAPDTQNVPSIIADNSGGAIIGWMDSRVSPVPYVQRINASGVVQWTANGVVLVTAGSTSGGPPVMISEGGGAIVAWSGSVAASPSGLDIYIQRVNASGVPVWTAGGVIISQFANAQRDPIITSDNTGGAIVAWSDFRNGNQDLYAQRVNSVGTPQWSAHGVALTTETGAQAQPQILPDELGGAIVSWLEAKKGLDDTDIYAQRINSTGSVLWSANGMAISDALKEQEYVKMTKNGSGGVILTWQDKRDVTCCGTRVYAQNVSQAGVLQWNATGVPISGYETGQILIPEIAADGNNGAVITWMHSVSSQMDIAAQNITATGSVRWQTNGTAVSTAAANQFYPQVVVRELTGDAIFIWQDFRSGATPDLYANRITCDTPPGEPFEVTGTATLCEGATTTYSVNPVNDATRYEWQLPSGWTGSSTTNSITVTAGTTSGNVSVAAANGCGAGPQISLAVTVSGAPPAPATMAGPTAVCAGTAEVYEAQAIPGATYIWTLPSGWTGTSTTNVIFVTIGTTGGNITVKATNACGTSGAFTKITAVSTVPPAPVELNWQTPVCAGSQQTYSVDPMPNVSYNWTVPSGWTGFSPGQSTITVTAGNTSGNISVTADNSCGSSVPYTKLITVNPVPNTPGAITGSNSILIGSTNTYTLDAVANATQYTWTLPSGWTGTSTTNSITTTSGLTGGTLSVVAKNSCGSSAAASLVITTNKHSQIITFELQDEILVDEEHISLDAIASSGLPVTYSSSDPGIAFLTGSLLTVHTPGTVEITASQAGDNTFLPAESITRMLTVFEIVTRVERDIDKFVKIYPNPGTGIYQFRFSIKAPSEVQLTDITGREIKLNLEATGDKDLYVLNLSHYANGLYIIKMKGLTPLKLVKQ